MPSAIVRNASEATRGEEQHLVLPRIGAQGPPMTEDDRLACAPVFEVDPRAVLCCEPIHRALLSSEASAFDGARRGPAMNAAILRETGSVGECGRRAGVEIDTHTVEELRRLKDPLVATLPEGGMMAHVAVGNWNDHVHSLAFSVGRRAASGRRSPPPRGRRSCRKESAPRLGPCPRDGENDDSKRSD